MRLEPSLPFSPRARRRRSAVGAEVYRLHRPAGKPLPVLVSVPHAGLEVPAEVRAEITVDDNVLRCDADLAVDQLYGAVPDVGAHLLVARLSRYVVDLNRGAGDVDRFSVPDHPAPLADARRGVIWRTSTCGRTAMARPLSLADLERRLARFHEPYHSVVRELMSRIEATYGEAILIDGHSMPSHGRVNGCGWRRRADIVPGCDGGGTCAPELLDAARSFFRSRNYSVSVDDPYRGGFITRNYGRPERGWHALQIEVNRDLYLDPVSLELKPRGLARLRADFAAFIRSLGELRLPERSAR